MRVLTRRLGSSRRSGCPLLFTGLGRLNTPFHVLACRREFCESEHELTLAVICTERARIRIAISWLGVIGMDAVVLFHAAARI